jgi:beta-lactam-binding protein with PASTA domain
MKALLTNRQFWRTLALMIVASVLIMVLTVMSLNLFTRHGQAFIVPDLTDLRMEQLHPLHEQYGFNFVIIDSIFDPARSPGTVLRHDPVPGATVKRGRKFYITLASSTPDMVGVPNLVDLSLRQATALLQSVGLRLGNVTYQPGYFQNAVIDQRYRGFEILPGERLQKGSRIDLIVSGSEQSNERDQAEGANANEDNTAVDDPLFTEE